MPQASVVIIGAGASGLSAAAVLQRRGIDPVILEQDTAIGGTWARRYDGLHLHTVRTLSGLAYYPIPRRTPKYPSRDEYVAYLKDYAGHFKLRIVTDYAVRRVRMEPTASVMWQMYGEHDRWEAPVVILATQFPGQLYPAEEPNSPSLMRALDRPRWP